MGTVVWKLLVSENFPGARIIPEMLVNRGLHFPTASPCGSLQGWVSSISTAWLILALLHDPSFAAGLNYLLLSVALGQGFLTAYSLGIPT